MLTARLTIADAATPRLRALAERLADPRPLFTVLGRVFAEALREHFVRRDAEDSPRHGEMSTHFWSQIRSATQSPQLESTGVSITIADPRMVQKVYGGVITAKNAASLTIPLNILAHGRRASVFEQETGYRLFRPLGKNVLMANVGGQPTPIYALVKSVSQSPDPNALPDTGPLGDKLVTAAETFLTQ